MSRRVPRVGSVVEVTLGGPDGRAYRACLEDVVDGQLSVALPADPRLHAAPGPGHPAVLRWSEGPRGTATAPAWLTVRDGTPARLVIDITGPVALEQNRRFVRGGGYESIELRRELAADPVGYAGWAVDLSEASVCGRFRDLRPATGE